MSRGPPSIDEGSLYVSVISESGFNHPFIGQELSHVVSDGVREQDNTSFTSTKGFGGVDGGPHSGTT